jgi:hypothetical protein
VAERADALDSESSGVAPHESSTLSLPIEDGREQVQILAKPRLDIAQFGRALPSNYAVVGKLVDPLV